MVNTTKIDGTKLRTALLKRGVRLVDASEDLGYSKNYLKYLCDVGAVRPSVVQAIEKLYNIKYEEYQAVEKPQEAVAQQSIDYNELYKCIYSAVYEAMKKALEGGPDEIL